MRSNEGQVEQEKSLYAALNSCGILGGYLGRSDWLAAPSTGRIESPRCRYTATV